jgi:hypothetical protein
MVFIGYGIAHDVRARLPYYRSDWRDGAAAGARILAPSTFIFLASALPAIAFGQQLSDDTGRVRCNWARLRDADLCCT